MINIESDISEWPSHIAHMAALYQLIGVWNIKNLRIPCFLGKYKFYRKIMQDKLRLNPIPSRECATVLGCAVSQRFAVFQTTKICTAMVGPPTVSWRDIFTGPDIQTVWENSNPWQSHIYLELSLTCE